MEIDFREMLKQRHRWAHEHKQRGGQVVGCYTAMVPEELMWACGVLPIQFLMSPGPYSESQSHLPPYVCDCSRSMLEDNMKGAYDFLDGQLLSHVCETIRGLAGIYRIRWPDRWVRVFAAPAGNDPGAKAYLKAELLDLAEDLARLGSDPLREDRLESAIAVYNENRALMRQLYHLRGQNPGAVAPEAVLSAVMTSGMMPKEQHNRLMRQFLEAIPSDKEASGPRMILSGLLFENEVLGDSDLFSILRRSGARVVWDDLASGMRYRLEPVDESQKGDPLDRLAEGLLGPQPAPLRSPAEQKAQQLLDAAHTYGAEGVIFLIPKYCDPILFEVPTLTDVLKNEGVPTLSLEVSGSLTAGQMSTRVEAFMEMISDPLF